MSETATDLLAPWLLTTLETRSRLRTESALPIDTVYRIAQCRRCRTLAMDTLGFPGDLQLAENGTRPCDSLSQVFQSLEALLSAEQPSSVALEPCPCFPRANTRDVLIARLFHAMPGTGAEVAMQVLRVSADAPIQKSLLRVPLDGVEQMLNFHDDAIVRAFGRPLRFASFWRSALTRDQVGASIETESGFQVFAVHSSDPKRAVEAVIGTASARDRVPVVLDTAAAENVAWSWLDRSMLAHWTLGAVVDLVALYRHLRVLATPRGVRVESGHSSRTVLLTSGAARWPVELETVAQQAVAQGVGLASAAAAALASAQVNMEGVSRFLTLCSELIPSLSWEFDQMIATPLLEAENVRGQPFDLLTAPFEHYETAADLRRDLDFHLGRVQTHADPAWVCSCGAARWMSARLMSAQTLDPLRGDNPANAPVVLEDRADAAGQEVSVVGVLACDRHVELLRVGQRVRFGLESDTALSTRISQDTPRARFAFRVQLVTDPEGARLLVASGRWIASVLLSAGWLRGLVSCAGDALSGDTWKVAAIGEHMLVVSEHDFAEPAWIAQLQDLQRIANARAQSDSGTFVLRKTMRPAAALGHFVRLAE